MSLVSLFRGLVGGWGGGLSFDCCYFIPSRMSNKWKLQMLLLNVLWTGALVLMIYLFIYFFPLCSPAQRGGNNKTFLKKKPKSWSKPWRLRKLNEFICCKPKSWERSFLLFFLFQMKLQVISNALCSESPPAINFVYLLWVEEGWEGGPPRFPISALATHLVSITLSHWGKGCYK